MIDSNNNKHYDFRVYIDNPGSLIYTSNNATKYVNFNKYFHFIREGTQDGSTNIIIPKF